MTPRRLSRTTLAAACMAALACGLVGFSAARLLAAQQDRGRQDQGRHQAQLRELLATMLKDPQAAEMMTKAMSEMMAHQMMVHDLGEDPQLKQAARDPKMMRAMQQVKAMMKDHQQMDRQMAETMKEHKEVMTAMAHALMMQDPELAQAMEKLSHPGEPGHEGRQQ